jgi:hypothetical protein
VRVVGRRHQLHWLNIAIAMSASGASASHRMVISFCMLSSSQ